MSNKKSFVTLIIIISMIISFCASINVWAQTEGDEPAGDEGGTFITVAPDALIILDQTGSMNWSPAGGTMYINSSQECEHTGVPHYSASDPTHTKACTGIPTSGTAPYYSNTSCSGPFYTSSQTGYSTDCRRLSIAKRALLNILDDDNSGTIDNQDALSLQVRIGYMRFYNCSADDTGGSYSSGCNSVVTNISTLGSDTGTSYQKTYCGNSTSCASTVTSCTTGSCIAGATATGGTPLASSLKEAKIYLDAHKARDSAKSCRQKFVIILTDGADTYACSGNGTECQEHMYKRRREVVAAAKALGDAGYKVFVVGFGSTMPQYLQYTLNWMAYYGGSDNPLAANSGTTTHYNIPLGCNSNPAVVTACCNLATNSTACFPSGVTSNMQEIDSATQTNSDCGSSTDHFMATNNDPGYTNLSGYAFIATNADDLTAALKSAFGTIRDATYSFTQAAVQAVRTVDENFLYEASFQPASYDPFWIGHMKRYTINNDGTINTTADWDAGTVLSGISASSRNILTYTNGSLKAFTYANLTNANLGAASDTERNAIINYFRGGETNGAVTNWKLGDVYHTSPMSIGTPNANFVDKNDKSEPQAFNAFRTAHIRSSTNGKRLIMIGANDGQMHAFKTGEIGAGGGQELWSFIPPNLLPKLKAIAHTTHPTLLDHQYFVDGPLSASDLWLGTGTVGSTYKSASDWYTYLIMSEARGGIAYLWSSSTSCDSGFSPNYSSTYSNYCGYYAFDVTSTLSNPTFVWRLGSNAALSETDGKHLGQAWSKMFIGRVRINNSEKWVGLIGGGYSGTDCKGGGTCDTRGKGFYVVDLSNGSILWRFTHSGPSGSINANMDYNLVAGPIGVDSDNDGFLDTAYVGDLGGNVWRFKFCLKPSETNTSCTTSDWSGGMLFETASGNIRPIYTPVAVTIDDAYNLWVYFATGDKTDPTAANAQEKIYAIKDNDRTTTYNLNNLDNLGSAGTYTDSLTNHGWYFNFTGGGEKVLGEPVIFEKRVYFTSYVPANGNDPCEQGGVAKLFVLDYITGAGKYTVGGEAARSITIGSGIATSPIISRNPYGGTDVYVSVSESAGPHATKVDAPTNEGGTNNTLIYWHDRRVQ